MTQRYYDDCMHEAAKLRRMGLEYLEDAVSYEDWVASGDLDWAPKAKDEYKTLAETLFSRALKYETEARYFEMKGYAY